MKIIKQFGIILTITAVGEIIKYLLPLPIPGNIYGLLILLVLLLSKVIKLDQIKNAADFLLEIMPLMFIAIAAKLIDLWAELSSILIPLLVILPVSTFLVMIVTGKISEFLLKIKEGKVGR